MLSVAGKMGLLAVAVYWLLFGQMGCSLHSSDEKTPATLGAHPTIHLSSGAQAPIELPPVPAVVNNVKPQPKTPRSHALQSLSDAPPVVTAALAAAGENDQPLTGNPSDERGDVIASVSGRGAALLNLMERGEGPSIEIAWPQSPASAKQLFDYLHGCVGMRVGRLDGSRLGSIEPGVTQRMSGYLRLPAGSVPAVERRIQQRLSGSGRPVRLFPRRFDQLLLSGLDQSLDGEIERVRSVRARYALDGGDLYLTDIHHERADEFSRVLLWTASDCGRRSADG